MDFPRVSAEPIRRGSEGTLYTPYTISENPLTLDD